ncbi:MAG: co-chaperone GroES [Candidatus Nealsonbacteria bacterium]|nr:co-chaperone GroES [Candidatus Nealsonbacteria bacterium]
MKIKPLLDNVLIEPAEQSEQSKGGIIIPKTTDKERPEQGIVIAVGPGKKDQSGNFVPMSLKEGDKVLFNKYGPTEIKVDDKEYLIAKQEDVLAVIEK